MWDGGRVADVPRSRAGVARLHGFFAEKCKLIEDLCNGLPSTPEAPGDAGGRMVGCGGGGGVGGGGR